MENEKKSVVLDHSLKMEYLKMIQQIINRNATSSFIIKGWNLTLFSGLIFLITIMENNLVFLLGFLIAILFWIIDSSYLHQERKFKKLYDTKVDSFYTGKFSLTLTNKDSNVKLIKSLFSLSTFSVLLGELSILIAIWIIMSF